MQTALRQLLSDFLSAIVFLVVYGLSDNIYLATAAAVGVAAAQVAIMKSRGQPIDAMQWLVLGLVLVLGAATLITSDSRFIMVKPSIIHCAVGAVMLRRGWMIRYLPPIARDNLPESVMVTAGYAWAALMFVLGSREPDHRNGFQFPRVGLVHYIRGHRGEDRRVPDPVRRLQNHHRPQVARGGPASSAAGPRAGRTSRAAICP